MSSLCKETKQNRVLKQKKIKITLWNVFQSDTWGAELFGARQVWHAVRIRSCSLVRLRDFYSKANWCAIQDGSLKY